MKIDFEVTNYEVMLHEAIENKDLKAIEILINQGANVYEKT